MSQPIESGIATLNLCGDVVEIPLNSTLPDASIGGGAAPDCTDVGSGVVPADSTIGGGAQPTHSTIGVGVNPALMRSNAPVIPAQQAQQTQGQAQPWYQPAQPAQDQTGAVDQAALADCSQSQNDSTEQHGVQIGGGVAPVRPNQQPPIGGGVCPNLHPCQPVSPCPQNNQPPIGGGAVPQCPNQSPRQNPDCPNQQPNQPCPQQQQPCPQNPQSCPQQGETIGEGAVPTCPQHNPICPNKHSFNQPNASDPCPQQNPMCPQIGGGPIPACPNQQQQPCQPVNPCPQPIHSNPCPQQQQGQQIGGGACPNQQCSLNPCPQQNPNCPPQPCQPIFPPCLPQQQPIIFQPAGQQNPPLPACMQACPPCPVTCIPGGPMAVCPPVRVMPAIPVCPGQPMQCPPQPIQCPPPNCPQQRVVVCMPAQFNPGCPQ